MWKWDGTNLLDGADRTAMEVLELLMNRLR